MGELGTLGGIIFIWARRIDQNSIFDGGDYRFTPLNQRYGPLKFSHMFIQEIHTCAFAMIYTSIEMSPNAPMLVQGSHICYNCYVGNSLHWAVSGYVTTLWANFWTIFFLLSVSARLKKTKQTATLHIVYIVHGTKTNNLD